MGSLNTITDLQPVHQFLELKVPETKQKNEVFNANIGKSHHQESLDANFSAIMEIYYNDRNIDFHSGSTATTTTSTTTTTSNNSNNSNNNSGKSEREPRTSPTEMILEFGENTSMHGLSRAMADRPLWRRLIWAALVIGFVVWATYNTTQIISDFQGHPVMTSVSNEYQGKLQFPAVTICNMNRIRNSRVPRIVRNLVRYYSAAGARMSDINEIISLVMRNYPAESQKEMGHQLEDMLFSCTFGAERCSADNFTYIYNLQYGNCYTFASSQFSNRSEWSSKRAGPRHGLNLELDIQYGDYLPSSPAAGVKVVIHDNGEVPFPEDGGLIAGPGLYTTIGIRKSKIKRLPDPYGNCIQELDTNNNQKNLFAKSGFKYSLNACLKSCFQVHIYKACNCCDSSLPCDSDSLQSGAGRTATGGSIEYCNVTSEESGRCLNKTAHYFAGNKLGCAKFCPPPCEESTFSKSVSIGKWPTRNYLALVMYNRGIQSNIEDYIAYAGVTMLKVDIYFDSLSLEKVESQPAYSWNKLLGDIGGQLGLMLGFSILTAVEILELLIVDLGLGLGIGTLWRRHSRAREKRVDVMKAWS
ncbi:acid-sensing ion channel 4 [Elysia marginata]|uniref:Acid-sensing ion channel 4 n=1 Tax=Elysia marginata TaxID=1093978 RepID=A0AAV4H4X2_9GAST|nr:acid-sensing ion channel 4 [Elysia marginata]